MCLNDLAVFGHSFDMTQRKRDSFTLTTSENSFQKRWRQLSPVHSIRYIFKIALFVECQIWSVLQLLSLNISCNRMLTKSLFHLSSWGECTQVLRLKVSITKPYVILFLPMKLWQRRDGGLKRDVQQEADRVSEMKRYHVHLLIRTSYQNVVTLLEEMNNLLHC